MLFKVYTDGACKKNGKTDAVGGWGYIILTKNNEVIVSNSGAEHHSTNQRMEICAILKACQAIEILTRDYPFFTCNIYSDSAYCINCVNDGWYLNWEANGWKTVNRQAVKNRDLWEQLIKYFKDPCFNFIKVKGHSDDIYNCQVDKLAQDAAANCKGELSIEDVCY